MATCHNYCCAKYRVRILYGLRRKKVAHTGFEPVISALRGRCPSPLDECANYPAFYHTFTCAQN